MKYGWEIADEVQRFVSNSADSQFIHYSEYKKLEHRIEKLREALIIYCSAGWPKSSTDFAKDAIKKDDEMVGKT